MRVYKGKYLSVTSILALKDPFDKSSFINWCKKNGFDEVLVSNLSRVLGEKVSEYLNNIQQGLESITAPLVDDLEVRLSGAVDDFVKEYKLESTEQEVFCDKLHYAGRFDGIVSKNGQRYLVDWKTYGAWRSTPYKRSSKKIRSAREQLSLYAYALGWKDKLGVVIFKNNGTWELEEVKFGSDIIKWVEDNQELICKTIQNENKKHNKEN